jgi:hypothetical protein
LGVEEEKGWSVREIFDTIFYRNASYPETMQMANVARGQYVSDDRHITGVSITPFYLPQLMILIVDSHDRTVQRVRESAGVP